MYTITLIKLAALLDITEEACIKMKNFIWQFNNYNDTYMNDSKSFKNIKMFQNKNSNK